MRVGLIAPPFIPVPPVEYGGTELFLATLAEGLARHGIDAVVYSNGESSVNVENRHLYSRSDWPVENEMEAQFKDLNHTAWAVRDAAKSCDIIHLNSASGVPYSRFVDQTIVYTVHHPRVPELSEFYSYYPEINFVTISDNQRRMEDMLRIRTIHHGVCMKSYELVEAKQPYLAFIGRIAPVKGVHVAIEVARRSGIPLKIAGEVQPIFQSYFESEIKPHIDGKFIEYVGPADLAMKNELLGNAAAMLFPVLWDEPFGLVMIEAMACGTPVIALCGGSVREVVKDDVSGCVCGSVDQMVEAAQTLNFWPAAVREYAEEKFSAHVMVERYVRLYESLLAHAFVKPQPAHRPNLRAVA